MKELLIALTLQASQLSGLPWDGTLPKVRTISPCQILREYHRRPFTEKECKRLEATNAERPLAFFIGPANTITIGTDLDIKEPGAQSLLVHELTHFLQNRNGLFYAGCKVIEGQAYEVQAQWLEAREFDPARVRKTGKELKQCVGGLPSQ